MPIPPAVATDASWLMKGLCAFVPRDHYERTTETAALVGPKMQLTAQINSSATTIKRKLIVVVT